MTDLEYIVEQAAWAHRLFPCQIRRQKQGRNARLVVYWVLCKLGHYGLTEARRTAGIHDEHEPRRPDEKEALLVESIFHEVDQHRRKSLR